MTEFAALEATRWWATSSNTGTRFSTTIPIGAGRRAFLRHAFERVCTQHPHARLVLAVAETDLISLWRRGIAGAMGSHDRPEATTQITITDVGGALRELDAAEVPVLLVVDEPHLLGPHDRAQVDHAHPAWRIDLTTNSDHAAPEASTNHRVLDSKELGTGRLIAGLLDGELEKRTPTDLAQWARDVLSIQARRMPHHTLMVHGFTFELLASAVAELLPQAIAVADYDGASDEPGWMALDLLDSTASVPRSLRAAFPAGTISSCPMVLTVEQFHRGFGVGAMAAPGDIAEATRVLAQLRDQAASRNHPYRGRTLTLGEPMGETRIGLRLSS
jgi:hypothetical protein